MGHLKEALKAVAAILLQQLPDMLAVLGRFPAEQEGGKASAADGSAVRVGAVPRAGGMIQQIAHAFKIIAGRQIDSFGAPDDLLKERGKAQMIDFIVLHKESYQVSRTPPAIVRIQQDGALQTAAPPSKNLGKLLKWTVHTLEIFWWGEDHCGPADVDPEDAESPLWSAHVEYSNGETQDMGSVYDLPDNVLELLFALTELFE